MADVDGVPCFEAAQYVDEAMRDELPDGVDYFVLGGIASSALLHEDTWFDFDTSTVHTSVEASDMTVRPNGTLRDIDILVGSALDEQQGTRLVEAVEKATGGALEVSVFGFERHEAKDTVASRLKATASAWTSDRTIDEDGVIRNELYPVSHPVNPDSFRPWRLHVAETEGELSVFNPAGHLLAYKLRSISGIRAKDAEKVAEMQTRLDAEEGFVTAVDRGSFKEWREFAQALEQLRHGDTGNQAIKRVTRAEIAAFQYKARLLAALESSEWIVRLAQQGKVQDILKPIVGAK